MWPGRCGRFGLSGSGAAGEGSEQLGGAAAKDGFVNGEGGFAVNRRTEGDIGCGEPVVEADGALGGNGKADEVAAVLDGFEGEAAGFFEAGKELVGGGAGGGEALWEAGQGVEGGEGGHPAVGEQTAVDVAELAGAGDEVAVAGEDSAEGGAPRYL